MAARPRVLIVEDEPDMLQIMRINLQAAGFETLLAADGETALERIVADHPDVVLLDLMLPVMDGWSVLSQVQTMTRRPAVVVCSARGSVRDQARAAAMGARGYVSKPFELDHLTQALWDALAEPAGQEGSWVGEGLPLPRRAVEGIEPA